MSTQGEVDLDRVKEAADSLAEHFDAVHVFATRYQSKAEAEDGEDGTVNCNYGTGNWFARYGHVRDWCIKQEEFSRIGCRKED